MFEEMIMRFVMELIMIAPYWLITYLAIALFAEKHTDEAGRYTVNVIKGKFVFFNSLASVALAATGAFTTGFFAGMPDMRVVIVFCFLGFVAYAIGLKLKYKNVATRFKQRAEAKAKMQNI